MGGMGKLSILLLALSALSGLGKEQAAPATSPVPASTTSNTPRRLYIEERVKTVQGSSLHCDNYGNCFGHNSSRERNVSLEVTREVMKQCPSVLIVTDNFGARDFDLRISPGNSTLYRANGDVAYISPARFRVPNLAKDICGYARANP